MKLNHMYMLGGFLVGCFIGLKVLPALLPFQSSAPDATSPELITARADLARHIETSLLMAADITDAKVQLTSHAASVTLTLTGDWGDERLAAIASQVASAAEGIAPGQVSIFDSNGEYLNKRSLQEYEQRTWWRRQAVNVAKVLGILAALVTLKYIIQVVGRARALRKKAPLRSNLLNSPTLDLVNVLDQNSSSYGVVIYRSARSFAKIL